MTFQYRGDIYDKNAAIEMAQVQPEPVKPILPSYSDEDPSDSHITLHQAARDGRVDIVKQRIGNLHRHSRTHIQKVLDKRDEKRTTALHYAVRYGHVEVAKQLVEAGASLSREGEDGATALHYAARFRASKLKSAPSHTNLGDASITALASVTGLTAAPTSDSVDAGDESLIKFLVQKRADINCQDKYGWTPLHFAASKRNIVACTEVLAVKGVGVDLRDTSGQTPLHIAANEGDHDVLCALLKDGADPRAKDNEKKTPLHFAATEGKINVAVELLKAVESQQGPDSVNDAVNDRNSQNETVLHAAVEGGYLDLVKLCLEKGANSQATRSNLAQPLHLAAINGHVEIAKLLISHHAKIEAKNIHHETPLHKAAFFNRFRMVEFLLSGSTNIECNNKDNLTPLLMAAVEGHTQLVKILLGGGASMFATDVYEKTAIFLAAEENNVDTLKVLLEHSLAKELVDASDLYENTPLHIACTKGFSLVATLLLDQGAQIDARNEDEHTPLHLAAKYGKIRCLKELLKKDPSILNDEDEASNTTLHLAALEGQVKCVRELLEHGAEVDARNNLLWTPLDCAAAKGQVKTAEVLLEYNAPVDPIDKAKTTPLHLASTGGHTKVVQLLLRHGADIGLTDHTGRNCLDMAIDHGCKDCAALIIDDENWMDAMKSKTMEGGTATTPMRKLICKLPDVAGLVFNKCVTDNGKHVDHPYYEVRLNYEFLEDVYADWFHVTGSSDTASVHSLEMEEADNDDFYHGIRGDREEEKATRQLESKANHPLILMVDTKREHLLCHPLVTFLLQYKWRTFGRYVYYIKLLMYCLFLLFLTSYSVYITQHPPRRVNDTCQPNLDESSLNYKLWVSVGKWIIIILAVWHLVIEIFQMIYQGRQYFALENLLEWLVFVLAVVYVAAELNLEWFETNQSCWSEQQSVGAVSIFLAWTNLVLFIRKIPLLGIYVVMFTDILSTFLKFFLIFLLFIVSFALSFYILLSSQKEFGNPGRSIVKTVVMMIGEFDFANIFYPENEAVPAVAWALFVVFVIVVTLLLMNLLIGLAVDDIKGVQEQAVLTRHAMQVDLALDVEKALPRKLRKRLMTTYETIQPNQFYGLRAYLNPAAISPKELRAALNPEPSMMEKLELQNDALRESVTSIKSRIKSIQTTQDELVAMVRAVVDKLEASVEEESEKGELF